MNFDIIVTTPFERKFKRLLKKHKSLSSDLQILVEQLSKNPLLGNPIGKNCYKIRIAISSKGKGKSGGGRIITYVRVLKNTVYLMDIYDKSEQVSISNKELQWLIGILSEE